MNVVKYKELKNCLAVSNGYDILLSTGITFEFINYLGKLGKLVYSKDMEKPYFNIQVKGKFTVKGIEGNETIRVIAPATTDKIFLDELIEFIQEF